MDILQIVAGLIIAIASLITAVGVSVRLASKGREVAFEAERKARQDLIDSLRRDLTSERDDHAKLKSQVEGYKHDLSEMRTQVGTLLTEMAALQAQQKNLQSSLVDKQAEIEKLEGRLETMTSTNTRLFESNRQLSLQVDIYERTLALLGQQLGPGDQNALREGPSDRPKTDQELSDEVKRIQQEYRRRKTDELRAIASGEDDETADEGAAGEG